MGGSELSTHTFSSAGLSAYKPPSVPSARVTGSKQQPAHEVADSKVRKKKWDGVIVHRNMGSLEKSPSTSISVRTRTWVAGPCSLPLDITVIVPS